MADPVHIDNLSAAGCVDAARDSLRDFRAGHYAGWGSKRTFTGMERERQLVAAVEALTHAMQHLLGEER